MTPRANKLNAATRTTQPAARCESTSAALTPPIAVSAAKPPTRISDTRLEMVMVRRSLEAANAIIAGNSVSLRASATMIMDGASAYLNASWTKVELSFEPSPCTTAMIATEMPAATRPYSTAVAPDTSFTKRFMRLIIFCLHGSQLTLWNPGGRYCPADPEPGRTLAGPTLQRG